MIHALLLLSTCLPLGATDLASPEPLAVAATFDGEAYDTLVEAYESAYTAWREKISAAESSKERKALRAAPPAADYWPRFEKLASQGEGQALLWMATHVTKLKVKSSERGAILTPIFESLVSDHVTEDWFSAVPGEIYKQRRKLGEESALALLARIVDGSKDDEVRASALLQQYLVLGRQEGEEAAASAAAILERLSADFPNTAAGMQARVRSLQGKTEVGMVAPDFGGKSIDGFEFKLSEFRGKVVMLDFYGFW